MRFLLVLVPAMLIGCASPRGSIVSSPKAPEPDADIKRRDFGAWQDNPSIIADAKDAAVFWAQQKRDHAIYGSDKLVTRYKTVKWGDNLVEQRSDRKRLYDHNIFLKGMFLQKVVYGNDAGHLAQVFHRATFIDIGSAILQGEGAPTVRDLVEDSELMQYLGIVVATDINDTRYEQTRYIEIARASGKTYPFPIREIPLSINLPQHVQQLLDGFIPHETTAVIFRSCNSGPDLLYSSKDVELHLKAIAAVLERRDVLYFFGRFVLYKPKNLREFHLLGEIDHRIGLNHEKSTWLTIDWKKRRLNDAFFPNKKYVALLK